jgi:hypothetical protein
MQIRLVVTSFAALVQIHNTRFFQAHMLVFFSFASLLETRAISLAMQKKLMLYLPEQFVKGTASSATRGLTVRKLINLGGSAHKKLNDEKCSHLLCSHR